MANKVTIDVEARFVDNLTDESKAASKAVEGIGKEAQKATKQINNLSKKRAKPTFDADDNKFLKKIKQAEARAEKLGKKKTVVVLKAMDKATSVINKVLNKSKSIAGKIWTASVKVKNSEALSGLKGIVSQSKSIAGKTWSAIVKIKDMATSPLQKIKNSLFSIKSLVMAITAGFAAKQFVLNPINLADSYSSTKISFSTLLGEEKGQQMMDDLDEFAKKTPFKTSGVIENAQKMMAMGWDAENIISDMETIGNAAAATGKLDQGLESIVRAMSQIKTKGKLSAEELNQLAEAGIAAKPMLAEALGYGTGDEALAKFSADQEKGLIGADKAIEALLQGMKKYDGMMESMANETVEGLWSQLQDTFEINILRKWGQGLQDGAKRGLGAVVDLLDSADDALSTFGDTVYEVGKEISNWAADKLEKTVATIKEIVGSKEFKEATLGGKLKMLWTGAIGNPFSEWWDTTVVPWWNGTAVPWLAEKASALGTTLGTGLTNGLLALFGASGTMIDGAEQGASIAGSFVRGFTDGFDGSAITQAFANAIIDVWDALPWWAKGLIAGKAIGSTVGTINSVAGGVSTFAGNAAKFWGSTGNSMVQGTGLANILASAGYSLTGGAATAGGYFGAAGLSGGAAAAIGGGSILGGILGLMGIGSGIKDIYKGTQTSGKARKDNYFSGGTKLGLVGTGAAIGTAIAPGLGTLIGAGVGGLGALFGGEKLGKWLSDLTDEGGALDTMKESITEFFTETVPAKWSEFWASVGNFFTETIPYAIGYLAGKAVVFFTETIPTKWDEMWNAIGAFFTETIPTWASNTWSNNILPFFTETVPGFFSDLWDAVGKFFTESLPSIGSTIWGAVKGFFTDTIPSWISGAIDGAKTAWGNFTKGYNDGKADKARGGIVGGSSSMNSYARGGMVRGGSKWIRVAEEGSPEMIIPLSNQRRDRGLKLWAKAGSMMGVPGFARGGLTNGGADEGVRFRQYGGQESVGGQNVQIDIGGITFEITVHANEGKSIVEAIKEQAEEIAETVAGIMADALGPQFENTPVRGGAA